MTNKQLAIATGVVVLAGLGVTAYVSRRPRLAQPEGVCAHTRRTYAQSENKYQRIDAKKDGEFFRCPWTTPEGLVQIEIERGNPQATRWLQEQTT